MPPLSSLRGFPDTPPISSVSYSTISNQGSSALTPKYGALSSTSSHGRRNHGSLLSVPSGNHTHPPRSSRTHHLSHPYHEASGKIRPSPPRQRPMSPRTLSSGQVLFYLRDSAEADRTVAEFRESLAGPLGFDIEYKPKFTKGGPPNKTALIQLASQSLVLLVQVSAMSNFPHTIREIIEDPIIVKAGVGIHGDAEKLWNDFGVNAAGCLELGHLARAVDQRWADSKGLISVARLVKAYEDRDMKKPKKIQMSNWELFLSEEQQDYAASDATAGFNVLQKLYAILPSIVPAPPEALYLFHLRQGKKVNVDRPGPPKKKDATVNSTTDSVATLVIPDIPT